MKTKEQIKEQLFEKLKSVEDKQLLYFLLCLVEHQENRRSN